MSLINEALKRARQESRRREALAKGVPLAQPPRAVTHRSWMTAAVVALALALLLSLVTILRLANNDEPGSPPVVAVTSAEAEISEQGRVSTERSAEEDPASPAAAPVSTLDEDKSSLAEPVETELGAPPESAPIPEPVDRPPSRVETVASSEPSAEEPNELASPPTEGVSLAPSVREDGDDLATAAPTDPPEIFVGTAVLATGDTLELGGIAWSESGPYALMDNRVVGLGETIRGYMVTRIAPQEVELESADGVILIRLK